MDRQVCVIKTLVYRAWTDRHTADGTWTDKSLKTEGPKISTNYIFYFKTVIIGGQKIEIHLDNKRNLHWKKQFTNKNETEVLVFHLRVETRDAIQYIKSLRSYFPVLKVYRALYVDKATMITYVKPRFTRMVMKLNLKSNDELCSQL